MASPAAPRQLVAAPELRWIAVWSRAVVVPAGRRALASWIGCAIVSAVIFGPTAMHPSDLTAMARQSPAIGAVLGGTWLLIFLPSARLIVRPSAAYLATLPHAPIQRWAVAIAALIGLQLPWLVLWVMGEGAAGLAAVALTTVAAAALGRIPPASASARPPAWRTPLAGLISLHRRALRRRAGDALLRGAGLAILCGLATGFPVRNNDLTGEPAAVLAASILAVVLIPAQLGPALVTFDAHRASAWLAQSLGISRATRIAGLVAAIAAVHLAAAVLAALASCAIAGPNPWLVIVVPVALGTALAEARALLAHEASPTVASRVVVAAVVAASLAIVCLAVLGAAGALAIVALGAAALGMVKP
jgi:hypothetical protein